MATLALGLVFGAASVLVTSGGTGVVLPLLLLAGGAAFGARLTVLRAPRLLARVRRARAVGTAPRLVGRMALRARLDPSPEAAAAAGAEADGPLAERLATHVRRARARPESGLDRFAADCADRYPAMARSVRLLAAATAAPPAERDSRLDRATEAVVDGVRDRAATAAADLRGPATALYAFGVLLPLALVGLLPAVATAGVPGPTLVAAVVVGYDLLLPAGLLIVTAWLLASRPVAFPRAPVPRSHPDRHDGIGRPVVIAVGAALAASIGAGLLLPDWTAPVAALGCAGLGLAVYYRPAVDVRDRARAIEAGLPDALVAVGRQVSDGVAVERALPAAADRLGVPVGPAFAAAATRGERLGVGIERSFLGAGGPFESVPSPRLRTAVRVLALAAREGRPAGRLLVETGEHFERMRAVERRTRRRTARLTATVANTAALFGPLVGGVTVALAGGTASRVGAIGSAARTAAGPATGVGAGVPVAPLGLAVGWYVLVLAAVLTALATGLRHGLDRARIGYRVGLALPAAALVYCAAVSLGGLVV